MNENEWKGYAIEKIVQQVGRGIDINGAEKLIKLVLNSK